MKRSAVLPLFLCLLVGFLVGGLLPMPWDRQSVPSAPVLPDNFLSSNQSVGTQTNSSLSAGDSGDNLSLLTAAFTVANALRQEDFSPRASFVHPEKGVTFTPYSTVDFDSDLTFTQEQVMELSGNSTVYTWGTFDGRGDPIQMTAAEYFPRYVSNADYTKAPQIGIDHIMMRGNALENIDEAYPEGRFVDFCFPQQEQVNEGMDWCSLKLVFERRDASWLLVGIVHGEWTI